MIAGWTLTNYKNKVITCYLPRELLGLTVYGLRFLSDNVFSVECIKNLYKWQLQIKFIRRQSFIDFIVSFEHRVGEIRTSLFLQFHLLIKLYGEKWFHKTLSTSESNFQDLKLLCVKEVRNC